MKKVVASCFLFIPVLLFAQRYPTGKGTFRTGGGGSYSQANKGEYTTFKLTVTPRLGYFITDEILLGFQTNLAFTIDTNFVTGIKFTPQVKYYYSLNKSWFLLGNFEYGFDRTTTYSDPIIIDDNSSLTFGPGVAYFYSRRIGFEINTMYQVYISPNDTHVNRIVAEGGVVFNILNKKDRKKEVREKTFEPTEEDDE